MVLAAGLLIALALIFGPSLWVKLVMKRYSSEKPEMPGTGGELAKHLIEQFSLKDVKVEITELGDHYDPIEKKVRLLREHYESKSLTAIAISAHEVGHAIQDHQGDKRLATRTKMVPVVDKGGSVECCHYLFIASDRYYYPSSNAIFFIAFPGVVWLYRSDDDPCSDSAD
jgi:Zn-dependent membrane protease YugP